MSVDSALMNWRGRAKSRMNREASQTNQGDLVIVHWEELLTQLLVDVRKMEVVQGPSMALMVAAMNELELWLVADELVDSVT